MGYKIANPLRMRQMAANIRTADKNARISLPSNFANCTVIVEQISDTEVRIRKVSGAGEEAAFFYATAPDDRAERAAYTKATIKSLSRD